MKRWIRYACGILMLAAPQTSVATDVDPAEMFGRLPAVSQIGLSPDGARVSIVGPAGNRVRHAYIASVGGGLAEVFTSTTGDPMNLRWCRFANDSRLICSIWWYEQDQRNNIYTVTRLFAIDDEGDNLLALGQRGTSRSSRVFRQFDGSVIDWLPDDPDHVMLTRGARGGRSAVRLSLRDATTDIVARAVPMATSYLTDGHGRVRIMELAEMRGATGTQGSDFNYRYRTVDSDEWRPMGTFNTIDREGLYPVAIDRDLNIAYGFERLDGRRALYSISLDGSLQRQLVYAHDHVDVNRLFRLGRQGRVIGAGYSEDHQVVEYFDEEYRSLAEQLSQTLPDLPLIRFIDASDDENRVLIWAGSDTDPGRYYVFDKTALTLNHILDERPALAGVDLAEVRAVTYPARDGTQIPGYLTLPHGGDGRDLPAIVMPHGGPESRDEWGFDWLAQYFAHRGFAVLQPNFRGSSGYGTDWLVENGFRGWQTAIGDINDGARWLVSQGIARPDHLAIVGWSYGGYAALQSGVHEPGLFRAIVAIAPVTDLPELREDERDFVGGRNFSEYLGTGPHILDGSPARNAERITAPVLMFHGEMDLSVRISQSRIMHDRLQDADKSSELVEYDDLGHSLVDSTVRMEVLQRSDEFIREALGL